MDRIDVLIWLGFMIAFVAVPVGAQIALRLLTG